MHTRPEDNEVGKRGFRGPLLLFWFFTFPLGFFFYLIEQKRLKLALAGLLPCGLYAIAYMAFIAAFMRHPVEMVLPPWYLKTTIFTIIFWLIVSLVLVIISKAGKSALSTWIKSTAVCTIIILISLPLIKPVDSVKAVFMKFAMSKACGYTDNRRDYVTAGSNKIEGEIQLPEVSVDHETNADDLLKVGDFVFYTGKGTKMSGNSYLMTYKTASYRVVMNFYNKADPENPWPLNKINYTNDYDFYERMFNMTYSQVAKSKNYNELIYAETLYGVKLANRIEKPLVTFENQHIKGFLTEINKERFHSEIFSKNNEHIAQVVLWSDAADLPIEDRKELFLSLLATFRPADTLDEDIVEKAAKRFEEIEAKWQEEQETREKAKNMN